MKIHYNIILIGLLLFFLFILINMFFNEDCDCCKEPFNITNERLISSSLTAKQCQEYCKNNNNCKYANHLKDIDKGEKQKCWISTGFGKHKILPGGEEKDTWENTLYKPIYLVKGVDKGGSPFSRKRTGWKKSWYRWYCRRWGWRWWRWYCRSYRWTYRWVPVYSPGLNRKLKKGESDCDRDSDCAGKLKCYQRSSGTVPGIDVSGISRTHDFCYDPEDKKYV
jgi:hypothetical protein